MSTGLQCKLVSPDICNTFFVTITFFYPQFAPFVLKGYVSSAIIKCYVTFWNWYQFAVRTREHTDNSLKKVENWGIKYIVHVISIVFFHLRVLLNFSIYLQTC